MSSVIVLSREELISRRAELLRSVGSSEKELRERAPCTTR